MADESSRALDDLLRKAQLSDDGDFWREGVRVLAQALMEVEGTQPHYPQHALDVQERAAHHWARRAA